VIHSWATEKDNPKVMPRWGKVGKQKIEDTGPLTRKRMETCDDEFVAAAQDFIKCQEKARLASPVRAVASAHHVQPAHRPFRVRDRDVEHLQPMDVRARVLIYAVQAVAANFAETFKEFPSVQRPNSFTIDRAMAKMQESVGD
jgi:hypothetical protein